MSVNAAWLLEVGLQMAGSVPSGRSVKVFSLGISGQHVKLSFLPWARASLGSVSPVWKEGTHVRGDKESSQEDLWPGS